LSSSIIKLLMRKNLFLPWTTCTVSSNSIAIFNVGGVSAQFLKLSERFYLMLMDRLFSLEH
jgi:hypothetical protein